MPASRTWKIIGVVVGLFLILAFYLYYQSRQLELLISCANEGDAVAQYKLGEMYKEGTSGVSSNPEMAIYWYEKAAKQGDTRAMSALGMMYSSGQGVKNAEMAVYWYEKAAEQGDHAAMLLLKVMYRYGLHGVPMNRQKAFYWHMKAEEQFWLLEEQALNRTRGR
jgi:TPR repeat protein